MLTFTEWFNQKFMEWERGIGKRQTIDKLAAYLGVNRSLVSYWLNGKRNPGSETIDFIAARFGLEVYDVLGLPRPDPDLHLIQKIWNDLPEEARHKLADQAGRYAVGVDHVGKNDKLKKPARETD